MEASPDALDHSSRRGSPAVRATKDIAFGSVAGMVSKVFEHPFDLTKVRLQSQVLDAEARFRGPVDCLVQTYKHEGVRGLYRVSDLSSAPSLLAFAAFWKSALTRWTSQGLPAPIVGAMAENASLFLAYGELQNLVRWTSGVPITQALSLPQLALAAGGAGAITSFLLTPIELVKCKMQVQMLVTAPSGAPAALPASAGALPGPMGVFRDIVRTTGVRGLWLGHMGTLIRETGGSAAWFGMKEFVASALLAYHPPDRQELAAWESALSGACAGASYNLAFFPADTVKSTMQTEAELRPGSTSASRSFGTVARELYRAQGVRGLYAGCGVTVARSVPSSALIFWIYDGLRARFG
ncbi:mitochondrial carrier [Artomyces pyxidatus]|uniref:Mitochondrial carrier n=1 Tax=Artomyces pyxidatus TaxID=48021 RepID=A0ACB8T9S7_9AGAM|nr:mitochondrial carrier [Artomyces pyxidatus]